MDNPTNPVHEISRVGTEPCFAFYEGKYIRPSELFARAYSLSLSLPEGRYAINLCRNRFIFTVSFLAVLFRGQTNLLPQSQARGYLETLAKAYGDSYCISDDPDIDYPGCKVDPQDLRQYDHTAVPQISESCLAALLFTSGSTGKPKAVRKTFGEFLKSARLAARQLDFVSRDLMLVSTVPPQHMYGLETSVFWPMVSAATMYSERPFFPEDIRRALAASEKPCLLISTPTHLKACVESSLDWTNLAGVLSSTASMPLSLAESIEKRFGAPLQEVFGSTETMSFATRRLTRSDRWRPYRGVRVGTDQERCIVQGGHLAGPVRLEDRVAVDPDGCFRVLGRSSDLVKIGGKRASLEELNCIINQIEGVRDGLFYLTGNGRLAAFVVSRRSKKSILEALRQSIDEVFLPRPLHRIQEIPRNEVGKVVKLKLERLSRELDIA